MEKNGGARPSVAPPFEFLWISSTDETSLSYHQFLVLSALVVVLSQICNVLVTFEKVRKQTYLYGVLVRWKVGNRLENLTVTARLISETNN